MTFLTLTELTSNDRERRIAVNFDNVNVVYRAGKVTMLVFANQTILEVKEELTVAPYDGTIGIKFP